MQCRVIHAIADQLGVPVSELLEDQRFQGRVSGDARERRRFYKEAILREEKQVEFAEDYLGFLASCEIKLKVEPYRPDDFERVAELVQRTNQLNFSGKKYDQNHSRINIAFRRFLPKTRINIDVEG